jgi:arginyl-tRNA synthetase
MTFRTLISKIRDLISLSVRNLGYLEEQDQDNFDISEAPRKEFGDLTCNIAFILSKKLKRQPYDIAKELVDKQIRPRIQNTEKNRESSISSYILSVDAHYAGYINFKINFETLSIITLKEIIRNQNYGFYNIGNGKRIIIEHTSVNPNKALHVGHIRNAIIGDTIYRILKATNHNVNVLYYIDDSGLQVADIVVAFRFAGFPIQPDTDRSIKFDQYCGDEVYIKINKMYETDPSLQEKRKLVLKEIEEGKSDIASFAAEITIKVLKEQLKTCWRIKSHYDLLNFESHIVASNLWSNTFELLKNNGVVIKETHGKNKGCWVIKPEDNGEEDKVIVRSDGTTTYIAKDIPYAAWKTGLVADPFHYRKFMEQWDGTILWATTLNNSDNHHPKFNLADMAITIIDSRQARLQRIVSQVLLHIQKTTTKTKTKKDNNYFHLGYEAVTISSQTAKILGLDIGEKHFMHMSGRRGIYVNADYILDKLHEKAYNEAKQRNPMSSEETLNDIAEKIAFSSTRYNMVKQDLHKIITFDIGESLSLEGDTGPYLQYAYARSQRILEKSESYSSSEMNLQLLKSDSEMDLIKILSKLDLVIEEAAVSLSPKLLARYAHELATTFNFYYETVPILKEKNKDIMLSRLTLVKAFGIVLKKVLDLLGIAALCKM